MKILHALVGYLAVTALPFQQFALTFASPLEAIDYDGYIVDTCQTVTTQNHKDCALMKRVPGNVIEARQWVIPVIVVVTVLVNGIMLGLLLIEDDDPKRAEFTQNTVSKMISQYPKLNWVICHSPYEVGFDGVEGTDWGYTHHELKISFGRTVGYDLYWARSGTFYRHGDGGFINWAYAGKVVGTANGGSTVNFGILS